MSPRQTVEIEPTVLRRKAEHGIETLRRALRDHAEVRAPWEAEEPVLGPAVRGALFQWLAEMRAASELAEVGLRPRATALLHGPPGCGKTTFAHHLAGRLGLPLVLVGAEMLMAKYLGESEQRVRALFDALAEHAGGCVVLMDEIEAIGGHRSRNTAGGADNARSSILTVLLRRVEEFRGILLGATNRPQDLDPALWRRFDLHIPIDLPGDDERFAILRRYGHPYRFAAEDLDDLSALTAGASPALLRGVMENLVRALVLAPRLQLDVSDPEALMRRIVASVQPPPEIEPPPLWQGRMPVFTAWPPVREAAA